MNSTIISSRYFGIAMIRYDWVIRVPPIAAGASWKRHSVESGG